MLTATTGEGFTPNNRVPQIFTLLNCPLLRLLAVAGSIVYTALIETKAKVEVGLF